MDHRGEPADDSALERTHRLLGAPGAVMSMVRPTLRAMRIDVVAALLLLVVGVASSAAVPKLVKELLYHDTTALVIAFVVVLAIDPFVNYAGHIRTTKVSLQAGFDLRCRVFDDVVASAPPAPDSAVRSRAASKVVTDVDRVEHGVEALLAWAIPGVLRIAVALYFLSRISLIAATLMAVAVPLFLVVESRLSGKLVSTDLARQRAADDTASVVDESLVALPSARGLGLLPWFGRRFSHHAHHLDERSLAQLRLEARLHLGTRIVALIGLAGVTAFGVWQGEGAGTLVSALLYVELAIVGLESLPPTLRALQQAEASVSRLTRQMDATQRSTTAALQDEDLRGTRGDHRVDMHLVGPDGSEFRIPAGAWVVVVDDRAGDVDGVEWLAGDAPPPGGEVSVDGHAVGVRPHLIASVRTASRCVDASVAEHLAAAAPDLDEASMVDLLTRFGVGHLTELEGGGLHRPLGINGGLLSVGEQHRLLLAMATAREPAIIVAGGLRPLADPLVARTVVAELRADGRTLITAAGPPELTEECDLVLFVDADRWYLDSHESLLHTVPAYVERCHRIDAGELGSLVAAGPLERDALRRRMVTERYESGDVIYRRDAPADRVVFVISGRVEIVDTDDRRVALIGPGGVCGDLRLTPNERRAETARAVDAVVVRTIGRQAWQDGMAGVLDADGAERRVMIATLRRGSLTIEEVGRLVGDETMARTVVDALLVKGALRQNATGELVAGTSARRAASAQRTTAALDLLGES